MSELALDVEDRLGDFTLNVKCTLPLVGVTALLGHSGAGKSSLLSALAGIRRPHRARVALGDQVLADTASGVDLPPEARGLGCVLQRPCLFPHMSVKDNCLYGARRRALPVVAKDAGSVMRWLDLTELMDRRPSGLSGGEQQRVALARALLSKPKLLLLDEPLAAVDARRRDEVLPYLEQVCSEAGVPVIYVSHAIDDVARLADRIVVMHEGRVRQTGDAHEVLSRGVRDVGFAAVNVLDGVVEQATADVAAVRVGEMLVNASIEDARPGTPVRMVVRASDVHVALEPPASISADNVIRGVVGVQLEADGPGQPMVLHCAGVELVAELSRAACARLAPREGDPVFAVFRAPRARPRGALPGV